MKLTRPMSASHLRNFDKLKFPVIGSPKRDGFRCVVFDEQARSKSLKLIANNYTRDFLSNYVFNKLDGELMLADPKTPFNEISSAFRKFGGSPTIRFYVFDYVDFKLGFEDRLKLLRQTVDNCNKAGYTQIIMVEQVILHSLDELYAYENKCLSEGFEGVMLRQPDSPYKQGRSTERECYLLKLKRTRDSECEILGFTELMHNENEKTTNELGLSTRATNKENKVLGNTLGNFLVRDIYTGIEFEIGGGKGLTKKLRQEIWDNRTDYIGELIKYEYQPVGVLEKPRFPQWLGFRSKDDLSLD